MGHVGTFENMIIDDGMKLIKFWFSIDSEGQKNRIQRRLDSPLERWKVSPVDLAAQEKWKDFTKYKEDMFVNTHSDKSPWIIVRGAQREEMRIQAIRYILSLYDYEGKSPDVLSPSQDAIMQFDKSMLSW